VTNVNAATFVTASTVDLAIPDLSSSAVKVGTYTIAVTLSDAAGGTVYTLTLTVSDPCLDNGIAPIAIPSLTAHVNKSQGSYSFPVATACGPGSFVLAESYNWLSMSQVGGVITISVNSLINSDAGVFALTM